MEPIVARGYVYDIRYHLVWCVKTKNIVLEGKLKESLSEILYRIAEDNGFVIEACNIKKEYVHLVICCNPQNYIPSMVKALKGVSARFLIKNHSDFLENKLWKGHFWDSTYFVSTPNKDLLENIRNYVKKQKEKGVF